MGKNKSVVLLVRFGVLLAIEAIFCFTPLGSITAFKPVVATLAMIPVIITTLLLGTKAGIAMGGIAGLFSFIVWTFMPPDPLSAFMFTPFHSLGEIQGNFGSVLICFVPRILVGAVTGVVYQKLSKKMPEKEVLSMTVAAILGSLTNTFGVLGGTWLFFGAQYSAMVSQAMILVIGGIILTNGIPEAIVAAIIAPAVTRPVKVAMNKTR